MPPPLTAPASTGADRPALWTTATVLFVILVEAGTHLMFHAGHPDPLEFGGLAVGAAAAAAAVYLSLRQQARRTAATVRVLEERVQLAQQLRESEERYRLMIGAVKDYAILMLDADGYVTSWNTGAARAKGYSAEEIVGQHFSVFYPPAEIARGHPQQELQAAAVEGHFEEEGWRVRKDGTQFWADVVITAVRDETGTLRGFLKITRDITDRKQAQDALVAAKAAADASNRAKSEFLANMSHEIRTPMNGILGMTDLVLDTALTAEQREHLTLVKSSADALLSVINDILDYSKIEAGKLVIDAIPFVLADSVGDTMASLRYRAHQKGLELAYDIDPEVPRVVIGDPGRLRQVLVNLLGNAIKFTHRGEVVVSIHLESMTEQAIALHLTVADTGIGIPIAQQAAIFEAFTQADGSMTRTYGGTGLGLTIAARFAALMGGRLWVDSEPGTGSRFHCTVSMARAEEGSATVPPAPPMHAAILNGLAALIVDDNATHRHILARTLTNWGMQPTAVDSGAAAIAVLTALDTGTPPPLMLLDAQMPQMDGFTLAEYLAQHPTLTTPTIMMLSSAGQRGDAARCRSLGMAAYLTKPVRPRDLLEAILIAVGTPAAPRMPTSLITRHALRERRPPLHVLLAEDVPVNQLLVVRLLEREGHTVAVVENGLEALASLDRSRFDLVLMDVQMPEMDGYAATAAIRERERITGGHIPIVAMTAHAMPGDHERCLQAGMDGYLTKPVARNALLDALEQFQAIAPPQVSDDTH